jgi:glycosyltransferase involved in cell wall biosynthesis
MSLLSVLIPSRNERFLSKTIQSLLENAVEDIEIIVVLETEWPQATKTAFWETPAIINDKRVIYLHREAKGMRDAINSAFAISKGEFIMKCDAHTMWAKGFDKVLKEDCQPNWIMIPRRQRLDPEEWKIQEVGKPPIDYEYITVPGVPGAWGSLRGHKWDQRTVERMNDPKYIIDETPTVQGSAWFMHRQYFKDLELMDEKGYGIFYNEAQEYGLKAWLSGGKLMTNKKTWYAHLHKGKVYGRGYFIDKRDMILGDKAIDRWLTNSAWPGRQTLPLSWLIERFNMPGWSPEAIAELHKYDSVL